MVTPEATTVLYRDAFQYANGLSTNMEVFASAMFVLMRDRIWQTGWIDQVHGNLMQAPSLQAFIERPVPKGINQTIPWTYAALHAAAEMGGDFRGAVALLNEQIAAETGETAAAIHARTVAAAVPELSKPISPEESGQRGGRSREGSAIRAALSSRNRDTASTLARLKRDRPDLAARSRRWRIERQCRGDRGRLAQAVNRLRTHHQAAASTQ